MLPFLRIIGLKMKTSHFFAKCRTSDVYIEMVEMKSSWDEFPPKAKS